MADSCILPEDVVVSILVQLPVMSLLRLRTVCKSWCTLIDSSFFVNQHLLHQDFNNNDCLLVQSPVAPRGTDCFLLSGQQFELRLNLDLKALLPIYDDPSDRFYKENNMWEMVASCKGIVCLSNTPLKTRRPPQMALLNLATRQLRCLPKPQIFTVSTRESFAQINLGFGYAVKADDYKVVRIVEFETCIDFVANRKVETYSLRNNCWRNIDVELPSGPCIWDPQKTYWNGHYCWMLYQYSGYGGMGQSILSFDLSDEVFQTMPLPDVLTTLRGSDRYLTTLNDSIACVTGKFQEGQFDIWVMAKFGAKESWTKLYAVRLICPFACLDPKGFSKNGEVLLLSIFLEGIGIRLAFGDTNTGEIMNLHHELLELLVYKESLVSLKKK